MKLVCLAFLALFWVFPLSASAKKASPKARRKAIQLFKQSEKSYRKGRFEEAAELLKRAYKLDQAPTLLYNLARALESAGDLVGAKDAYGLYLQKEPNAPDRAAIAKRIENLEAQLAALEKQREAARSAKKALEREREQREALQKAQAETPPPPPPVKAVVSAPPPNKAPVAPWVIMSIGVGGAVAGGVLGALANNKHRDAEDEPIQRTAQDLNSQAKSMALGANIAYAAGGALAVGGLIWGILTLPSEGEEEARLQPLTTLSDRGAQVGIAGRF